MISGKLSNDTVWWLSSDGKKIWIESEQLEQEKFKEKKYNIEHDRIFYYRKEVGELTTSRLDSRRCKDAWVIKLGAILDIYPELLEEINKKEVEEKKKKKSKVLSKDKKDARKELKDSNIDIIKEEPKNEVTEKDKDIIKSDNEIIEKEVVKFQSGESIVYFDINRPYVRLIKDEVDNSENGKMIISLKNLKEKMGDEFIKMHDMRIYFGLKKILPSINITIELGSTKGESMAIIERIENRGQ